MQLLQSDWFIRMVKKSASTPKARMLNIFTILDDWIEAPDVQLDLNDEPQDKAENKLQHYLTIEAAQAGAKMPEMLASQLYFMAVAAAHEKTNNHRSNSLILAHDAADAMILAQTKSDAFHIPRKVAYGIAASACLMMLAGGLLFANKASIFPQAELQPNIAMQQSAPMAPKNNIVLTASPTQTAALFSRIEQMRTGECRLLEALQLPDKYKAIYFENIIQGQISTDPNEQRIVHELLSKVRCNYGSMLMKNSRG